MIMKKQVISASLLSIMVILLLSSAPAFGASQILEQDGDYDVRLLNYSGSTSNVQSCESANTGYAYLDISSVNIRHISGVGYNLTINMRDDVDLSTSTYMRIYVDATGTLSTFPQMPAEVLDSQYTFWVQFSESSSSWYNRTWFNISNQIPDNAIFTGLGSSQIVFQIPDDGTINGTLGFDPDLTNWVIYGYASDDDTNEQIYAYDTINWYAFWAYLENLCPSNSGIPGYEVAIVTMASLGSAFIIAILIHKKRRV